MGALTCAACGIEFSVPDAREKALRDDGERFYCPNGHSLSFKNTETREKLREQRDAARRSRDVFREAGLLADRRLAQLRTCPLCSRRFRGQAAVADHLTADHRAVDRTLSAIASRVPRQIGA